MPPTNDRDEHGACECSSSGATACPACGQTGTPVQGQTVSALLSVTLRAVRGTQYLFCRTQTCPVVYFSADGQSTFTTGEVRERVYQKEPQAAGVSVCYCFRHTVGALRADSAAGRAAILDDIRSGVEDGQCACDLRNPQGTCCLGNVRRLLSKLEPCAPSRDPGQL